MIYQCNVILSTSIAAFAVVFLLHYVATNRDKVFFWINDCDEGFSCTDMYFAGPPRPYSSEFSSMIREMFVLPPPPDPDRMEFDTDLPVWRKLVDWNKVQDELLKMFKDRPPGFFVEVGVVDGEFMSQTLQLEKNLNWTGLLVEPDPRSYEQLVKMRRNAWLSPLCIIYGYASSEQFWLRRLEEDLPHHFVQLLMARSKLTTDILDGDEERGSSISVPCAPLSSILRAINKTEIDLLTINTGSEKDEDRIRDVIRSKSITTKFLILHYPATSLYKNPFPHVPGYIIDAKRSKLLVKIYIRKSFCLLSSSNACETIETFIETKACYLYTCFGYLNVLSVDSH